MNSGQNLGSSIKSESQTACLICSDMDWRPILLNRTLRGVTSLASNRTIINLIESLFVHFIAQVVKYYAKCAFLTFVQRPKVQYFPSIFTSHLLSHFMEFTTKSVNNSVVKNGQSVSLNMKIDGDFSSWTERSFWSKWKAFHWILYGFQRPSKSAENPNTMAPESWTVTHESTWWLTKSEQFCWRKSADRSSIKRPSSFKCWDVNFLFQ